MKYTEPVGYTELGGNTYFLLDIISQGGQGDIYIGSSLNHGKVALKIATEPNFDEFVKRESDILRSISHEHIVSHSNSGIGAIAMRGKNKEEGRQILITEFMAGGDLRSRHPLSPQETIRVMSHVNQALNVVHERGLVHADVKPENVLTNKPLHTAEKRTFKLADFGITQLINENQGAQTRSVASYEQAGGQGLLPESDVYSAALLIGRLMTGREVQPGTPNDGRKLLRELAEEADIPYFPIHARMQPVIDKATLRNPTKRHRSTLALQDAIETAYHAGVADMDKQGIVIDLARSPRAKHQETETDVEKTDQTRVSGITKVLKQTEQTSKAQAPDTIELTQVSRLNMNDALAVLHGIRDPNSSFLADMLEARDITTSPQIIAILRATFVNRMQHVLQTCFPPEQQNEFRTRIAGNPDALNTWLKTDMPAYPLYLQQELQNLLEVIQLNPGLFDVLTKKVGDVERYQNDLEQAKAEIAKHEGLAAHAIRLADAEARRADATGTVLAQETERAAQAASKAQRLQEQVTAYADQIATLSDELARKNSQPTAAQTAQQPGPTLAKQATPQIRYIRGESSWFRAWAFGATMGVGAVLMPLILSMDPEERGQLPDKVIEQIFNQDR